MMRTLTRFLVLVMAVSTGFILLRTEKRTRDSSPGDAVRRCAGITQGGKRCSRDSEPGSEFCWQHG